MLWCWLFFVLFFSSRRRHTSCALVMEFRRVLFRSVGPVDPVGEEVVGPAGPTTATRMDKFTRMMLENGLLAMVGKAERGPMAIDAKIGRASCRERVCQLV